MSARSLVRAARIVLLPISLIIAAAAFVHAGSETKSLSIGSGAAGRLGLDANILAALVDSSFRAEMASRQAQAQDAAGGGTAAPRSLPEFSAPLQDFLIALARDSFAVDPLEVSSLRTIALGSVLQEDEERARRLMRLASRISRRDSITNLWLAQDYGRAGDVEAMLASFDHTLRTNSRAREFAMKPVVNALVSEESYAPLGKLLAARPEWEVDFWREFVSNPVAAANAAEFFAGSGIPLERIPEETRQRLYETLKRERQFGTLYDFAARDPDAKASEASLAAGGFVTSGEGNPLGWTLHSRGNASAQVHRSTGELQIDARSGSSGIAAERLARIEGINVLTIAMAEPVPDNARLKLAVMCVDGAKSELAVVSLEPGDTRGEIQFVAGECTFANLELSFGTDFGRRDAFVRVASIALRAG